MFPKKSEGNKRLGDLRHMLRFANADIILQVVCEEYGVTTETLREPFCQKTYPFKVALLLLCHDTDLRYHKIAQLLGIKWQFAVVGETRKEMIGELRRDPNKINKLEELRWRIYAPVKPPRPIARSYGIFMPIENRVLENGIFDKKAGSQSRSNGNTIVKKAYRVKGSDHPRARNGGPKGRQSRIFERLRSCGQEMSARALRDMVGVGIMTFAKDMRVLVADGSVVRVGTSRWTRYRAAPDVGNIAPVKEAE